MKIAAQLLIGLVVLAACATPIGEDELGAKLRRVAASVPEVGSDAKVVPVHADGDMDAWSRVAQSIGEGPSGESRVLGRAFANGASKRVEFVVGGPYGGLSKRMLLDALSLVREPRLPGLTLLFVGPEDAATEVGAAARELGATFVHRDFPK